MKAIITRFAPSPTGNLHLGGIRTALINYIITEQAKKDSVNSKFYLRIEDTDTKRSTEEYKQNIINGLKWLGIDYDEDPYIQSSKILRHQEVAYELLKKNKAFKCICSNEYLKRKRELNKNNRNNNKRLCEICEKNSDTQSLSDGFVVRIKIPKDGETSISDLIQGKVIVKNTEIDDFVLLRSDGTPTYMLSVVVDDFDMGVNTIIRGDDHFNNTFRQIYIYLNMNWNIPNYAHIPLIHGEDGKKLSKRHGAVNINEFKDKGYLDKSIINNLILLGWSPNKKNEYIEIKDIVKLFNIKNLSKSSSIFSYDKLNFFNNYYLSNDKNYVSLNSYLKENTLLNNYFNADKEKFIRIFSIYKKNINFYKELETIIPVYLNDNFKTTKHQLLDDNFNNLIKDFLQNLKGLAIWTNEGLEKNIKDYINNKKIKFSVFGKPTRIMLINTENGPSISDIFIILGKKDSIQRIKNYISGS